MLVITVHMIVQTPQNVGLHWEYMMGAPLRGAHSVII